MKVLINFCYKSFELTHYYYSLNKTEDIIFTGYSVTYTANFFKSFGLFTIEFSIFKMNRAKITLIDIHL